MNGDRTAFKPFWSKSLAFLCPTLKAWQEIIPGSHELISNKIPLQFCDLFPPELLNS